MKKIFSLIFIVCIIFLSGCGQIEYSLVQMETGEVLQNLSVLLDNETLVADGYNAADLSLDVEVAMWSYLSHQPNLDGLTKSVNKVTRANNDVLVTATMTFVNKSVYYAYWDIDPNATSEDYEIEKTFYTKKVTQSAQTIFNKMPTFDYTTFFEGLESPITEFYTTEDVTYTYSYATYKASLRSDADRVSYDYTTGVYIHSWDIAQDDLTREIHFYSYSPNTSGWYITGLLAGEAFMLIMFGYIKLKAKVQHKRDILRQLENNK